MQQIARRVHLYILTVSDHIMSMIGNKRVATVRKPSPTRPEAEDAFRKKLEEIKKIRQQQNNNAVRKKVIKIVNGKPTLDVQGDWALFQSSSGKKYFFNMKTMTNQWTKPEGWIEEGQTKPTQPPLPR